MRPPPWRWIENATATVAAANSTIAYHRSAGKRPLGLVSSICVSVK
jgi:hypothetical protein